MKHVSTAFVLDCSVTMSWLFDNEKNIHSNQIKTLLQDHAAKVPIIWNYEVCNVLRNARVQKRITEAESIEFTFLLSQLPIQVMENSFFKSFDHIIDFALSHNLSVYDAAYLELAIHEGIPIASFNKELISAAKNCDINII